MSNIPHPEWRTHATPSNDKTAQTNPPCLLWPGKKGTIYGIRISQHRSFPSQKTQVYENNEGLILMIPDKLERGQWFWQFTEKGTNWDGDIHSFYIYDKISRSVAPPGVIIEKSRLLVRPRKLLLGCKKEDILINASKTFQIKDREYMISEAENQLHYKIPEEKEIRNSIPQGEPWQEDMFLERGTKIPAHERLVSLHQMLQAWLITGNKVYLDTSLQWGRDVVRLWDDEGIFSRNDFAASSCLAILTLVYDTAYEYLTEEEKSHFRYKILVWGERIFQTYVYRVESRVMENHAWQHILRRLAFAGLALAGEEKKGEKWLSYVYQVWTARFPILGGNDGGWANGNGYLPVNYESILYLSSFFSQLSGIEYLNMDWFKALPSYLSLTMPPQSACDYFGDGVEKHKQSAKDTIGFAHAMGLLLKDPLLNDYAQNCLVRQKQTLEQDKKFRWFRLLFQKEQNKEKSSLPPIHTGLFKEVGLAVFHGGDQMISFRSSPFGSFGHAHGDQNGFNINKKGIPLFVKAGYYTSFADPHNFQVYRHSWGQNTILPLGFSQKLGTAGHGKITQFESEKQIHWVTGNASQAYGADLSDFWLNRMKRAGITATEDFAFGDPQLKRFTRTLLFLEPHTLIIYDDLESEEPISWDFHLHSPHPLNGKDTMTCRHPAGDVTVEVQGSSDLESEITTAFPVKPESVKKPEGYPDQWHFICRNKIKSRSFRYLTIINFSTDHTFDHSHISVEMDSEKKAKLSLLIGEKEKIIYGK